MAEETRTRRNSLARAVLAALLAGHDGDQALRYSTPYQNVDTLVMYRLGDQRPAEITDLIGKEVLVRAGSRHAHTILSDPQLNNVSRCESQRTRCTAPQCTSLTASSTYEYVSECE
mgnify:CR=1 FL=1